mmetsp:Transcript_18586/g.55710  ORF Transcript_18586/g.55710 Transcript_18586/m.55710 type:complete len:186 (-) Transcript_18586:110-667(-)
MSASLPTNPAQLTANTAGGAQGTSERTTTTTTTGAATLAATVSTQRPTGGVSDTSATSSTLSPPEASELGLSASPSSSEHRSPRKKRVRTADDYIKNGKVILYFKAAGSAPRLIQNKFKMSVTNTFQAVIDSLRKHLELGSSASLFLFINSTFQPNPEERILDLFKCFQVNGRLVVNYCLDQAWG